LSYSPVWFKNIAKRLEKHKLKIQAQPLQYGAQTEVPQVGKYHILDRPACPGDKEEPYPAEAKHAQKYGEGIINRSNQRCQEQDSFRPVAVNKIVET